MVQKTHPKPQNKLLKKTKRKHSSFRIKSNLLSKLSSLDYRIKIIAVVVFALIFTGLIVGKTVDGSIPNFVGSLSLTVQDATDNIARAVGGVFGIKFKPKNYEGSINSLSSEDLNTITEEGKSILTANQDNPDQAVEYYATKAKEDLDKGEDKISFQILSEGYNTLYTNKLYDSAIKLLDQVDITAYKPVTQNSLYLCYYRAYDALDNKTKAEEYYIKAKEAKSLYEK